jgi:hypothetical protein
LLQTTLQRCPRNSVEQLGQIEDASFCGFAGARFARRPLADRGATSEPNKRPVEFNAELMSGVVAQIALPENMIVGASRVNPVSTMVPGVLHSR